MEAARIFATIGANTAGFVRGMTMAGGAVQGFAGKMAAKGKAIAATGRKLTRGVTLPILAVGAAAGKMSLDFEKSMTNIRALVGASEAQMKGYEKSVLAMARTMPQGPKELADALYFVVSSGFEGAAALRVLRASAKAAAAGLGSTVTVADAVTSAVNAYGEKALSASKATDILLAAVREGKAEPEELAGAIGRVIAPAQAMGVEFEEVAGAVASLSMVGMDAAEGVTALRGTLMAILKPSKQAREFLKDNGESIAGIRKELANKGLVPTLGRLAKKFKGNQDAIGALFPNVRALNGVLALTGKNAGKTEKVMAGVADSVGDTDRAFVAASESAGFKLRKAWSSIQVDLIGLGNTIVPVFASLVSSVAGLAKKFSELPKSTQKLILFAALGVAAVGPLLTVLGTLMRIGAGVARAVGLLATGFRLLGVALLFASANPIVAIIGGLILLGAAMVIAYKKSATFRAIVHAALNAVKGAAMAVGKFFAGPFVGFFKSAFGKVKGAVQATRAAFGTAWNAIKNAVLTAVQFILKGFDLYLRGLSRVLHAAGKAPGPLGKPFRVAAQAVDGMRGKVGTLQSSISRLKGKTVDVTVRVHGRPQLADLRAEMLSLRSRTVTASVDRRAAGGPVSKGSPYMVGERGRELFIPNVSGMILSNRKLEALMRSPWSASTPAFSTGGGGGPTVVYVHVEGSVTTERELVETIDRGLQEKDRRNRSGR